MRVFYLFLVTIVGLFGGLLTSITLMHLLIDIAQRRRKEVTVDTQKIKHIRPRLTLEAMQVDGTKEGAQAVADWVGESSTAKVLVENDNLILFDDVFNHTRCTPGDWIMKAITGKFFTVPNEQFGEIYELVGERIELPPSSMVPKKRL